MGTWPRARRRARISIPARSTASTCPISRRCLTTCPRSLTPAPQRRSERTRQRSPNRSPTGRNNCRRCPSAASASICSMKPPARRRGRKEGDETMAWEFEQAGKFGSEKAADDYDRRNNLDTRDVHITRKGGEVEHRYPHSALDRRNLPKKSDRRREGG